MVMQKYLGSIELRTGAAIIGFLCIIYYGLVGYYLASRFLGDGPQYGLATRDTMLNYGQLAAYLLIVISAILLITAAFGDHPKLALMFLICGGVYVVWCSYMVYIVASFIYKSGWKMEAGYNIIFEFLFMLYNWLAVLSYVIDEDCY